MNCEVFDASVRKTLGISYIFMWIILLALALGVIINGAGAGRAIENVFIDRLGLNPCLILIHMQLSFILAVTFLDDTAMLEIVAPSSVPLVDSLRFDLVWYGVLYRIIVSDSLHGSSV